MALTAVEGEGARSRALARALGVPCVREVPRGDGVRLIVREDGISLAFNDPARGKPYRVELTSPVLTRAHIFRRALGDPRSGAELIDATAGFGGDAMMSVTAGFTVTAVERSPVVAALLADALARAGSAPFTLVEADAVSFLSSARADVVYLDPMFSKPKTSAKSPKEMQLLKEILLEAPGEAELFAAAWRAARRRVVVKRPLKAPALAAVEGSPTKPSHAFRGQSVRYDVYVK